MDFNLDSNLDLLVKDGVIDYLDDNNNETTMLCALFTNGRANESEGYWLDDIISSDLWIYDQSVLDENKINSLELGVQATLNELVEQGFFTKIDATADIAGNEVLLKIKAYKNDKSPVIDKIFKVAGYS